MTDKKTLRRPFSGQIWNKAAQIAAGYHYRVHMEDGGWFGSTVEMPLVMAGGNSASACIHRVQVATATAIATMIQIGEDVPAASL